MGANAVFVNKMLLKFQLDKIRRFVLFPGQLMTVHAVGIHVDGVPHQRPYQTLRQCLHNGNERMPQPVWRGLPNPLVVPVFDPALVIIGRPDP